MLKRYVHIRFQKRNGYTWADKNDFKAIRVEESFEKKNAKRTGTGGFPNKIQDGTAIK